MRVTDEALLGETNCLKKLDISGCFFFFCFLFLFFLLVFYVRAASRQMVFIIV